MTLYNFDGFILVRVHFFFEEFIIVTILHDKGNYKSYTKDVQFIHQILLCVMYGYRHVFGTLYILSKL